jgi:hypothetical protein
VPSPRLAVVLGLVAAALLAGCRTRPGARGAGAAPATPATQPAAPAARAQAAPAAPDPALADQRARLTAAAKRELGLDVRVHAVEERWVLLGAPGLSAARFTHSIVLTQAALTAYFNDRFRTRPPRALAVYLFADGDSYHAFCQSRWKTGCPSKFGFYDEPRQRLVVNTDLGLGTLTHELVHPILAADFPLAPLWLNEGIASLYEAPVMPQGGEIHGAANWRLPRLRAALAARGERPEAELARLFTLGDATFRDAREELHYAQARYLCQWLDTSGRLWDFYHRWRDGFGADPTGARAFQAATGLTPAAAQASFEQWLGSL